MLLETFEKGVSGDYMEGSEWKEKSGMRMKYLSHVHNRNSTKNQFIFVSLSNLLTTILVKCRDG